MEDQVYTFKLKLDWKLAAEIRKVDRFDAPGQPLPKRKAKENTQTTPINCHCTQRRGIYKIEGSKMSDEEVEVLIRKLSVSKLEERDAQEVAGYFEAIDTIAENYQHIEITESSIKSLHNILC